MRLTATQSATEGKRSGTLPGRGTLSIMMNLGVTAPLLQVHQEPRGQREVNAAQQSWLHQAGLAAQQVRREEVKVKLELLLFRFLNMSLTPESGVRKQDGSGVNFFPPSKHPFTCVRLASLLFQVISSVARNTVGRYLAFDFIQDQWKAVKN